MSVINCSRDRDLPENPGTITLTSLLNELTDREALTKFPNYTLRQVSSWDRTQTSPDDPETWFNNKDHGYYIRKESQNGIDEYVIMDEKGPGCIVRWWIPLDNYGSRTVRIYIDDMNKPLIEENYNDLISGESFIKEPFAFISSDERDSTWQYGLPVGHPRQMGADLYFPIPFSKSCKITVDGNPFFYAINYRLYDPMQKVESFSMKRFKKAHETIDQVSVKLTDNEVFKYNSEGKQTIQPGKILKVDLPEGSNAVRSVQLKFENEPDKETLRSCVLQFFFDNKETGWCPVSEFFGSGVYLRPFKNRVNMVTGNGILQSDWVMPYTETGRIQLKNYGSRPITVEIRVATSLYSWGANSMYFHTNWHETAPIKTFTPIDWNYVKIEGKGVYAGDALTVFSFSKGWWGEGDEKIYLDNEFFPSYLGTGLEDYYGYAWGTAHNFSSPFISMPLRDGRGKGDWSGYTTVSRIRLLDGIPFKKALDVNVEAWLHDSTVSFSNATFWYAVPDAKSNMRTDESSFKRVLPGYLPQEYERLPGTIYPDPAGNGPGEPKGNGSIKHAGNHLDYLSWRSPGDLKPLDADKDNIYGSAGYLLIACKKFSEKESKFQDDPVRTEPDFADSMKIYGRISSVLQDTWLTDPEQPYIYLITGKTEIQCDTGNKCEIIRIDFNDSVPVSFRLGVMTDNADTFEKVGRSIRIISEKGGDSGEILLAKSNRVPDWYFFDIENLKGGDRITIQGMTENENDLFSLGGLIFDIKEK